MNNKGGSGLAMRHGLFPQYKRLPPQLWKIAKSECLRASGKWKIEPSYDFSAARVRERIFATMRRAIFRIAYSALINVPSPAHATLREREDDSLYNRRENYKRLVNRVSARHGDTYIGMRRYAMLSLQCLTDTLRKEKPLLRNLISVRGESYWCYRC